MNRSQSKLKDEKGQTLVEFALVLIFLLVISLGIMEFGRAWFLADRLKNAANIAARTYAVEKNWDQPGGAKFAAYSAMRTTAITVTPEPNPPDPNGTSVKVTVSSNFETVVPGILSMLGNITIPRDATYRIEQ